MKLLLLLQLVFLTPLLSAQTFTAVSPSSPFEGVQQSSVAFSDIDGDGDDDLLITGRNNSTTSYEGIAKLYVNDGSGHFTEIPTTPFDGVTGSAVAFSDVDGDGDVDLLITGRYKSPSAFIGIAKLYVNDGSGHFTEKLGTPFDGVMDGSISFSDVDGDGDSDLLITGFNNAGLLIAKLYLNDGFGNFIEKTGIPFEGVLNGSVAFSDVDGDGDIDLLITGRNASKVEIAKLYLNDGAGNFTEKTGDPFEGVTWSSVAFSDVDGDGDEDLLITGRNHAGVEMAQLYINDGLGDFSEKLGTPFEGVMRGAAAFSDVDGDGDDDLVITGRNALGLHIAKLYLNDGGGNFSEQLGTLFDGVDFSSIAFSDVDGDGDNDLLITGLDNPGVCIAKLYLNEGLGSSIDQEGSIVQSDFELYPNPANSNTLHIRYDSKERGQLSILLYDLNGRLLLQQRRPIEPGHKTYLIDISQLSKGVYFVRLVDGKRSGSRRLVIE